MRCRVCGNDAPESVLVGRLDAGLSEIDLLLTRARVALGLLSRTVESDSSKAAIADIQRAFDGMGATVNDLGKLCAREARQEGRGGEPAPNSGATS